MSWLWALSGWLSGMATMGFLARRWTGLIPSTTEARVNYRVALRGAKRLSAAEVYAIGVLARSPTYWPGLIAERAAALIDEAGA